MQGENMAKVIDEIRTANRSFMDVFKRGDAAGVAALYTPDARLLPPDSQMMNGTDAIRAFWQGAMKMGIKEANLETVEVEARDNLAYEIGKYTLTIQPAGGPKTTAPGKYVVVWKSEGGRWKLHVDIWNATAA
jgi:uncharacterized protein (TIGR02246 family)